MRACLCTGWKSRVRRRMRHISEDTITQAVIARHAQAGDARLRDIVTSLVQHLHAFAREVRLTEDEWFAGIRFLTDTGRLCTDRRQEFILLSDLLGLSMLVATQNRRHAPGCTEATVFGPFHVDDAPAVPPWGDLARGAPGEPCYVRGRVLGLGGEPVPAAQVEVWHADGDGLYDVQHEGSAALYARGRLQADAQGRFAFRTVLPQGYSVPTDGTGGELLRALGRHPWRPAHLHFMVTAPGYRRLITHVFRNGDPHLDSDAVFGVRRSLIADWVRHEAGPTPDGGSSERPFHTLDFDFVLDKNPPAARGTVPTPTTETST